jgi:hypothetical protein
MPDLSVPYVLSCPGGTITFNDTTTIDQFYITDIPTGLAGAPIRAPMDDLPYGDGGLSYNFWKGARHILFEGILLVQSVPPCSAMVTIWNEMEDDLRVALDSISTIDTATASLAWTALGQPARTLTVRNDIPLEVGPDQNYQVRTFHFGLVADNPVWIEST